MTKSKIGLLGVAVELYERAKKGDKFAGIAFGVLHKTADTASRLANTAATCAQHAKGLKAENRRLKKQVDELARMVEISGLDIVEARNTAEKWRDKAAYLDLMPPSKYPLPWERVTQEAHNDAAAGGGNARIKELEMALDDERAHCEEFMAEAERMKEERDEAREIASEGHRLMQNYFPDLKWIQLPWEGDEKCSSQS